jgi:carboxyl-terminal processing protease
MPASDSKAMTFGASEARTITANIVRLLDTKCIHLNGRDPAWRRLFTQRSQDLERGTSALDFERTVNELLSEGGLSHVAFFHETGNRAPARYAINATFARLESDNGVGPRWIFQDVHEGGPAHNAGIRPGDILVTVNGDAITPPALPTFALGTDATVTVRRADDSKDAPVTIALPKAPANAKATAKPPMAEPTSVTARLLDEEVGYLRVAFFPGVNGQRFARDLDAALAAVAGCTRLIVDLRGNLGGFVGSLRLMSHLTPDRLPIGYSLTRKGKERGWKPDQLACIDRLPASKFETLSMAFRFLVWHRDRSIRLMTEGLGAKPFHGKVVVLINEHTLSAGEMVAAFIAENHLATLVGTRTGGQVLGGGNFTVGHGFVLRLPAAAWYTWNGTVVEGVGVPPHVEVPLSPVELRAGRDTQLEVATTTVRGK